MKKRLTKVTDAVTAKAVLEELARRRKNSGRVLFDRTEKTVLAHELGQILEKCHEKQRELLTNTSRFKALLSPRRVGKTTYNLFEVLLHDLRFPGSMIAYIVPDSKAHAKDLFWLPMKELDRQLHLGLVFKEVEKRVIFPSGTNVIILGAHDENSPQRLRGNAYSLVLLDECKDFGKHFEELVIEAVLPGLGDYGGTLVLSGTPGNIFDGLFYKITTEEPEGWMVAKWIKSDNTFLRIEERDLQQVWETAYKPFGLSMDSPKFLREQKAMWVAEDSERAYQYHPERNYFSGELDPTKEWDFICGIDIGKRDKMIIQPAAFSPQDENLYYLETFGERGMQIQGMYEKWRELNDRYQFVGTTVDTGGLGVMIVDDINMRYGVNWEAAKKGNNYKLGAVEQMNNDLLLGRIKAHPSTLLGKAWAKSVKDQRTGLPTHSDECDAALYVHRYSYHWQGKVPLETAAYQTKEWWQKQEQDAVEAAISARKAKANDHAISDYD